jgi:hypothetical protein
MDGKGLNLTQALSNGDKAKSGESLYRHEIAAMRHELMHILG